MTGGLCCGFQQCSLQAAPVPMAQMPDDIQARLREGVKAVEAVQGRKAANHLSKPFPIA